MKSPTAPPYRRLILVCINERPDGETCCFQRGGKDLFRALKARFGALGLQDQVRVTRTQCLGPCERGANICIMPDNVWLHGVRIEDVDAIIKKFAE